MKINCICRSLWYNVFMADAHAYAKYYKEIYDALFAPLGNMRNRKLYTTLCVFGTCGMLVACSKDNEIHTTIPSNETDMMTGISTENAYTSEFSGLSKNDTSQSVASDSSETGSRASITQDEALSLIEEKYGKNGGTDKSTGNGISYSFEGMELSGGQEYYCFKYSWLVPGNSGEPDRISTIGYIFVSVNGNVLSFAEKNGDTWQLSNSEIQVVSIYAMQTDGIQDTIPTLILNSNYTFQFSYDMLSSYLPYGTFEKTEDKIVCRTVDGLYTYTFDIIAPEKLSFNEEKSSPIEMTDGSFGKPKNGSIFILETY